MADLSLDGLSSGMATNDTINQILNAEYGTKLNNLKQEKSNLTTQKDAWRDVNSRLDKLENKLTDLKLSSTFDSMKTTSTSEDIATATSTTAATAGNYTVDVNQLAESHRLAGQRVDDPTADLDLNNNTGGSFDINGTTINVGADDSLQDVVETINNQASDSVQASIVDNTLIMESNETGTANQLSFNDPDGILEGLGIHSPTSAQQPSGPLGLNGGAAASFNINLADGSAMTIDINDGGNNDSLQDIADAINNDDQNTGQVEATINNNKLTINSTNPSNAITSFSDNDNVLQDLGILNSATGTDINYGFDNELQAAQDAQFSVNGLDVTRSTNQGINDVVDEVTFDLKSTGSTNIEVDNDLEKATSAIQGFVDQYNSVQDFMNTKLDYDSESGKSGTLQGDSTLMRLQSNLRQSVTGAVFDGDGNPNTKDYNHLSMVGIEVDREGTMSFDSNKFKDAIENSPEDIKKLFQADKSDGDDFNGVAVGLDNYLDMVVERNTGVIPQKVDSYETMIDDVDDTIESTNESLESEKERLKSEFTAMETALSEMNNQMSWMQSQLSSMGGTSSMLNSMM